MAKTESISSTSSTAGLPDESRSVPPLGRSFSTDGGRQSGGGQGRRPVPSRNGGRRGVGSGALGHAGARGGSLGEGSDRRLSGRRAGAAARRIFTGHRSRARRRTRPRGVHGVPPPFVARAR